MTFYKYRRQWSNSSGTWKIIQLPKGYTPKSFFEEMKNEWNWSEHFRGIKYKKINTLPRKWLEEEILRLNKTIEDLNTLRIEYQICLKQL